METAVLESSGSRMGDCDLFRFGLSFLYILNHYHYFYSFLRVFAQKVMVLGMSILSYFYVHLN